MNRLIIIVFVLLGGVLIAQPYGNEWINYDQAYYTFKVSDEGVYRINKSTLQAAGIPVNSLDPRNFQLFSREQEVPIFIEGEQDSLFDDGDYIEFYATGNDGWIDEYVYGGTENQNNPHYSLYNDTLNYFLTWNDQVNNLRYINETDVDFTGYTPTNFVMYTSRLMYTNRYYFGQLDAEGGSTPNYTEGEGWFSGRFGYTNPSNDFDSNVPTPNVYTGGGSPIATLTAVSASANNSGFGGGPNHHLQLLLGDNNQLLEDITFSGYQLNKLVHSVNPNSLDNGTTLVKHRVIDDLDASVLADNQVVSYVEIAYPRETTFGNSNKLAFEVPYNFSVPKTYLEIENFNGSNALIYINDDVSRRVATIEEGGLIKTLVPNQTIGGEGSSCYIIDQSQIQSINSLEKVTNSGFFTDFVAFEQDSVFLVITEGSLLAGANDYAAYRQSTGFNTMVVDVHELYLQYGGGIEKCPIGIRRFTEDIIDNWDTTPSNLFLIGKSIRQAREATNGARKNLTHFKNNLVPSYGYPPSDVYITAELNNQGMTPAIPTGRLSAKNTNEVYDYLAKVGTFESQPEDIWKRNILHFGGGNNFVEQQVFAGYLNGFAEIISDTCFGGTVKTFLKDSSFPIEVNLSDSISNLIETGVSIMTFFGHAFAGGFDQSIDNPENLEWNGRFPLVIGNSCFTGDIHTPESVSQSEDFVLLKNKGAIAFLSSTKLGYPNDLNKYSSELYRNIAYKNYHKSLGLQMQSTIEFLDNGGDDFFTRNVVHGMTLHGDPSIVLNTEPKPDMRVFADDIYFDPPIVTLQVDSFDVNVVVENVGKTTTEPFNVEIVRKFPGDNQGTSYSQILNGLLFQDTVTFRLPVSASNGIGINSIDVFIDLPANVVDELDNLNNNTVLGKQVSITSGGIIPIYPYDFSVVPSNQLPLKASTGDPFAPNKLYRFELDTNKHFNSPFLSTLTLNHEGGVVTWDTQITFSDSTVYFWRVAEIDTGEDPNWQYSSFQYIAGKDGWGQAHFDQFEDNSFNQIIYNENEHILEFASGVRTLRCYVLGNSLSVETGYLIDTEVQEYALCQTPPGLAVAVIDPITLEPWKTEYNGANPGNEFGNFNTEGTCRNRSEAYFLYRQYDSGQMAGLQNLIENVVPDDHYVLLYSLKHVSKYDWDNSLPGFYSTLSNLGATQIQGSQDSIPYILFTQKGNPAATIEMLGTLINDTLDFSVPLPVTGDFGSMKSVGAGPGTNWESLHWKSASSDDQGIDSLAVQLFGIDNQGTEQSIFNPIMSGLSGEVLDLQNMVGDQYQNFKIQAQFIDDSLSTPAQLERWHLLYETPPEAAVNPSIAFGFYNDEMQEGEILQFYTAIENVSNKDMDSLLVNYWITDRNGQNHVIPYPRQAPLLAGEILVDTITFQTFGYGGLNTFWMEVNPINPETGEYDQLEQYHFNNIAQRSFIVNEDRINPILDVTFDGTHILDGDIVSAQPEIFIRLNDENPYLLMNEESDTTYFKVFMTHQDDDEINPVNFRNGLNEEIMQFTPASNEDNISTIRFMPKAPLIDGVYRLIVIASDKSGNESGDLNYKIDFEVINEATITEVLNYPNPFSTRTQFVFTLTGSELPEYMKIQIMTVTGKVVKEIFMEELGPIRIGRNITDYFWDGKDMYGDQLANGVYLYRVITKQNGSDLTKRSTRADQFFTKNFGKMYLMR